MSSRAFVVLEHTLAPGDVHYDLMLAAGEALVTFQLEAPPGPGEVRGRRSFDHRPRYLSYEGPVSGDRGHVRAWDRGQATDLEGEPRAALYRLRLEGERLRGEWTLREAGEAVLLQAAP
ncbi:MAG: DNA polymerase ligase N-terminal domain-containing protein [Planctomycetota bacterium]